MAEEDRHTTEAELLRCRDELAVSSLLAGRGLGGGRSGHEDEGGDNSPESLGEAKGGGILRNRKEYR
jgi:hypothetical protein